MPKKVAAVIAFMSALSFLGIWGVLAYNIYMYFEGEAYTFAVIFVAIVLSLIVTIMLSLLVYVAARLTKELYEAIYFGE